VTRNRLAGARSGAATALAALTLAVLVVFALPAAASGYAPQLKRYPYLTDAVGSSATVTWATDQSRTSGRIKYGKVGTESCTTHSKTASRSSVTVNGVSEYQWRVNLTGLAPAAKYCYRIELGTTSPVVDLLGTDSSPQFYSQLPGGSSQPFSFAVLGDWGAAGATEAGANNKQAEVMSQIGASGVRFAVGTGDTAYPSGTQANYGDLVQTGANISGVFAPGFWKKAGGSTPLFNATGNHGFNSTFLSIWPESTAASSSGGRYLTETYCCVNGTASASYPSAWYAFDAGSARFYVLEAAWSSSNKGTADEYKNDYDTHWTPSSAEYQWLENDLRTHSSQLKFAFFHFPLYSSNATEPSDTYLQGTNSLEGLLARNGVDIGFSGHAHNYTRNAKPNANSLVTYVTGGGGARVEPATRCGAPVAYAVGWSYSSGGSSCGGASRPVSTDQVFHFLKVSVDGTRVTVTPTDSQGRTFDAQTYDFPAPPPDTQSPTAPSGLTATTPSSSRAELSWTASSDNVGVTGYEIYRNDVLLATTTGPGTAYSDTSVSPSTTYTYKVRARDAAGNRSNFSNTATVTTPAGGGGPAGIAFARQATGGTPASTTSFNVPIASTTGNALVASIAVQAGTTTSVSSLTDSAGNTWTKGPVGFLSGSNTRVEIWYSTGAASVSSVTVNLSAPDLASANVSEWSGVAPAGALDLSGGQGNVSSTTASTPSITTSNADDLIVGAIDFPGSVISALATAGFTSLDDFTVSTVKGRAAYRVASATGSYSAAWTLSGPSTSGGAILALKAAP
jgi:chitodextrinase